MAVEGRSEEFELELNDRQREVLRRLTGHERNTVHLVARSGTIDPQGYGPLTGPVNGPYRLVLTPEQAQRVTAASGQEYQALYFDVVGTEPVFASIPSQAFPVCYPQPSVTTCDNKPPPPRDCTASEVLREAGENPLIDRFVPVHLRHFRDAVLRRTSGGEQLIEMYYERSPEISAILRSERQWLQEARELLLQNSAQIRAVTLMATLPEWVPLTLNIYSSQRDVDQALTFLRRISDRASPELAAALQHVIALVSQFGGKTTSEILAILDQM